MTSKTPALLKKQETAPKSKRGFAGMHPEKQREIARMGGRTAHAKGTAHTFTSEEAKAAGRKGGTAKARRRLEQAGAAA